MSSDVTDAAGKEGIIISTLVNADAEFLDRHLPALKFVARPGIGLDNVDVAAATERAIVVINTPGAPSESTAEHAVALMLALAKRVVPAHLSMTRGGIPHGALSGTEMRGLTLGVVGYGRVGRRVAEICGAGLGMRVLVYEPYLDPEAGSAAFEWISFTDTLDELLRRCDFLTLHAALTEETRGIIGAKELGMMRRGAYLINVSRGPVLDEKALTAALESGHLAGAGLDVFEIEPPLPDNPLLSRADVVVTPHVASFTDTARRAMGLGIVNQIEQIVSGVCPDNLVNPSAWPGRFAGKEEM